MYKKDRAGRNTISVLPKQLFPSRSMEAVLRAGIRQCVTNPSLPSTAVTKAQLFFFAFVGR